MNENIDKNVVNDTIYGKDPCSIIMMYPEILKKTIYMYETE